MSLEFLLEAYGRSQDSAPAGPPTDQAAMRPSSFPHSKLVIPGRAPIALSVERNTIKLEGKDSPTDNHIQEKVAREIEQSSQFLEEGIPISITCYVGGVRCTKQHEMIDALLSRNHSWGELITPHLTCNFSPEDTQAYLEELRGQGIQHILAVSGDKLDPSFKTFSRHAGLREAPQLVAMASSGQLHPFSISVAYSPFNGTNPLTEQKKMERKIAAGAQAVKTQPLTYADTNLIDRDHAFLSSIPPAGTISWSVLYFQSSRMAEGMLSRYRVRVPEGIIHRLQYAEHMGRHDENPRARVLSEGLHITAQSIACLIHHGARSINIMGVKKPSTYHKLMALVPSYLEVYTHGHSSGRVQQEAMVAG